MKQIEKLLIEEFKNNNVNFDNNFRYDYVDDSFTDVLKSVIGVVEKLTICDVVKPFYCGSDYNHNAGKCKSQCRMCSLEEKKGQQ